MKAMNPKNCNFSISDVQSHCKGLVERIFSQTDFHDVTLITDDEKILKTHRIILAANSEYFRKIMSLTGDQTHLIVLKGVTHEVLESIMKFLYFGETAVPQNCVKRFVETANFLKIEGLVEQTESERIEVEEEEKSNIPDDDYYVTEAQKDPGTEEKTTKDNLEYDFDRFQEILMAKQNEPIEIDLETEEEIEYRENASSTEDDIVEVVDAELAAPQDIEVESHFCDKCDFESSKLEEYLKHMRTDHINDIKCKECDFYTRDRLSLKEHMISAHNGISCNHCYQRFSDLTLLRRHVLSNDDCMSKLLH